MSHSGHTIGRQTRRVRLWLTRDVWEAIDKAASELAWDRRDAKAIENALEDWATRRPFRPIDPHPWLDKERAAARASAAFLDGLTHGSTGLQEPDVLRNRSESGPEHPEY